MAVSLRDGLIPFWTLRAPDPEHGGFFTDFDGQGERAGSRHDKCLVTQTRLLWFFSTMAPASHDPGRLLDIARKGFADLVAAFHDDSGQWAWRVARDGTPLDQCAVVYGQSFALYGLAAFARASGSDEARALACELFDLLVRRATDATYGGYYETFDPTAGPDAEVSDCVKTLDTHMHLLESFTELVRLTDHPDHIGRLDDVRDLILERMIDQRTGAGGCQYARDFRPIPPVVLERTWIAERNAADETSAAAVSAAQDVRSPANLTSYGHNLELAWLLGDADRVLGREGASDEAIAGLARHALDRGFDWERGGVFREGRADGEPTDRDKEFWQNAEALVGFLEAHRVTGDATFLEAFERTWAFAQKYLVHETFGEWRVRTDESGNVIDDDLGNEWKNGYHTGRALLESVRRLDDLVDDRKQRSA